MSPNLTPIRIPMLGLLACLALVAFAVAEGAAMATASAVPRATRSCNPTTKDPAYLPDGSGYFTSKIRYTNVSCAYSRKFIVEYWKCRTDSGDKPTGRCNRKVKRFSCSERRGQSSAVEINATVTCRRGGSQRIVHSYQQNIE